MHQETASQITTEKYQPDQFLEKLYAKISDRLVESGSQIYCQFLPQTIKNWDHHSDNPGPGVDFNLEMHKAAFFRNAKKDLALVLGFGKANKWDDPHLRLQFGFFPRSDSRKNLSIEDLKSFVSKNLISHSHGEFYIDTRLDSVNINAWADSSHYGGDDIQRRWSKEHQLLSDQGLDKCLEIVTRTLRQSYLSDLN